MKVPSIKDTPACSDFRTPSKQRPRSRDATHRIVAGRLMLMIGLGLFGGALGAPLWAADITAKPAGGDWSNPNTWQGGQVPGPNDNVIIPAGSTVTADGDKTCKDLTVNGTLNATDMDGCHKITAGGKITVTGTIAGACEINAATTLTVTGTGKIRNPPEVGGSLTAGGDLTVLGGGKLEPTDPRGPGINEPGKPTVLKSGGTITVDGSVKGLGGGGGSEGQKGAPGGPVVVDGKKLKGTGKIEGGDGGAGPAGPGKKGGVNTKDTDKTEFTGTIVAMVGSDVHILSKSLIVLANLSPGAITAEDGSVTIATCEGGQVDLRGNSMGSSIIVATDSVMVKTDSILLDPGVQLAQLTSPPALVSAAVSCAVVGGWVEFPDPTGLPAVSMRPRTPLWLVALGFLLLVILATGFTRTRM